MRAQPGRRRRRRRARPLPAELGIRNISPVTIRETEVEPGLRRAVELVVRQIVSQVVAAVVGEPQLVGARMPIEPDAVADAVGVDLPLLAVWREAREGGEDRC